MARSWPGSLVASIRRASAPPASVQRARYLRTERTGLGWGCGVSETTLALVAAGWGVIMALSPVMQIRRMMRLGSSRDVSIGYLLVIVIGFAFWIAYGIATSGHPPARLPIQEYSGADGPGHVRTS